MATLYVTEQGAKLTRESRRLLVVRGDETVLDVPTIKVERVLVFGYCQITTQALELLLNEGIPTAFLSMEGRLKGTLEPIRSKNIPLRVAQYETCRKPDFRLAVARRIVAGKIRNQLRLVQRFQHNRPELDFTVTQRDLNRLHAEVDRKTAPGGLLGLEGHATAVYFEAFRRMFNRLSFERRTRRPPTDPVNSLLSLGYTALANEYLSAATAVGLDPYLGFFHVTSYGRPSLALDLCEELRHPLVDMLTLDLINRTILKEDDFNQEQGGFMLRPEARKRYFAKYERRMTITFKHSGTGQNTSVRAIIRDQALKMAHAIQEGRPYEPYFIG
jgi:CRISPR-associated protein Cas1